MNEEPHTLDDLRRIRPWITPKKELTMKAAFIRARGVVR